MKYRLLKEAAVRELMNEDWEGDNSVARMHKNDAFSRTWLHQKMDWDTENLIGARPQGYEPNPFDCDKNGCHFPPGGKIRHRGKRSDKLLEIERNIAQMSDTSLYAGLLNRTAFGHEDYDLLINELKRRADDGNKRAKRLLTTILKREELSASPNGYSVPSEISMKATDRLFKSNRVDRANEFLKSGDYHPSYAPDENRDDVEQKMRNWKDLGLLDSEG